MFAAEKTFPIPTKDLASWIFDDPKYDQDEPVSFVGYTMPHNIKCIVTNIFLDVHRCQRPIEVYLLEPSSRYYPKACSWLPRRRIEERGLRLSSLIQ